MNNISLFKNLKRNISAYLFIAPFFIIYICFQMYPQIYSFVLSFYEYKFVKDSIFVGFQNYIDALRDTQLLISLANTAIFWLATLPVQLVVAFLIASVMVNLAPRIRGVLSGFYYLPVVTNLVAVILIFQLMFDENYGTINYIFSFVGIDKIPWLTDPFWAKISTILLITWRGIGYYVVYTLAGMMSVDRTLYEYAQTEGANYFQKQFYITLPAISPILFFMIFTGSIAGWNIFLEPFLLFNKSGGPLSSALTTSIYIYTEGFKNLKFGYGAAMSILVAFVTTFFAVMQFKILKSEKWGGL